MTRFIIAILFTVLSGCATFSRDFECDFTACQDDKWDKYDNWGKADQHANIDP